jgi:hypothetical protein
MMKRRHRPVAIYAAVAVAACRDLSTGISPLGGGDRNNERPPHGHTTSKGSMNVCCIRRQVMLYKGKELPQSKQLDLMTRTTIASEVATVRHTIIAILPSSAGVAAIGSQL